MVPVGGHGNPCFWSLIASSKTLESFALPSHPPWINVNCMSMLHTHNTLVLIGSCGPYVLELHLKEVGHSRAFHPLLLYISTHRT